MRSTRQFLILSLILFSAHQARAQYEQFDYPGAVHTYVTGMNDGGDFVGYYTDGTDMKGFYVIGADTGDLVFPQADQTWAHGISNDRKVVGKYNYSGFPEDNEGFVYDYYTAIYTDLTTGNTGNGQHVQIMDMNDNGCWTGSLSGNMSYYMMYDCNGYGTARYDLKPSYGTAINNSGDLAGYYIDGGLYKSYIWTGPGLFYQVQYPNNIKTRVFGMNDDYIVVGDYANQRGFIYDGFITGGGTYEPIEIEDAIYVTPQDINNNNQICGYFTDANSNTHGFFIRDYDIGFRPDPDAWNFSNAGTNLWTSAEWLNIFYNTDPYLKNVHGITRPFPLLSEEPFETYNNKRFPSWELFVETFGEAQTYEEVNGVLKIREKAFNLWRANSGSWLGSCFGLSYTALQNYDDHGAFLNQHPYIDPGFASVFSLPSDVNTRKAINLMHTFQMSEVSMQWTQDHKAFTPAQTLAQLKSSMVADGNDHVAIRLFNQNGSGGHSLMPFKIERDLAVGWENVYVYDSNFPNDTTRHIRVDKQASGGGAWYYESLINAGGGATEQWGGPNAHEGFQMDIPTSMLTTTPNINSGFNAGLNSRSQDFASAYFAWDADEFLVYGTDTVGFYNGRPIAQSNNATANYQLNSSAAPPIGYLLAANQIHNATITNAQSSQVYMDVFTDDALLGYQRNDATQSQIDLLQYEEGLTYVNPDATSKPIGLKAFINQAGISYHYWIDSISCEQGGELHIEPVNGNELIVSNTGTAKTYDLRISILSPTDASTFEVSDVPFAANGTHHIVPSWGNLIDDGIYITVDTLLVGVDDTLFLENQALPAMLLSDGELYYSNTAVTDTVFVINSGGAHLNWSVDAAPSWLLVTEGNSGTDDHRIVFDIEENNGPDRSGWLILTSNDPNAPDSILITQSFASPVSSEILTENDRFIIYPNPANGVLNVGFNDQLRMADVTLLDIQGRAVQTKGYEKGGRQLISFDLGKLASGMYLVKVSYQDEVIIRKVMIE